MADQPPTAQTPHDQAASGRAEPPWYRALFTRHFVLANETTTFILVTALDFFVTYVLLSWPNSPAYEANPIARRFFSMGLRYVIAFKFGLATIGVVCCEIVARRNLRLGRTVLITMTIVVVVVVAYGIRLIARHLLQI